MKWPRLVAPFAASTQVSCCVDAEGIDEDGAPVAGARWSGPANWQDASARTYHAADEATDVAAVVYIDGDAFPDVAFLTGGKVEAFGGSLRIAKGSKARNPDGTVNYTRLDLA